MEAGCGVLVWQGKQRTASKEVGRDLSVPLEGKGHKEEIHREAEKTRAGSLNYGRKEMTRENTAPRNFLSPQKDPKALGTFWSPVTYLYTYSRHRQCSVSLPG